MTTKITYSTTIELKGVEQNVVTEFSRLELDSLPLTQWAASRTLGAEPSVRTGTYLNIVNASHDAGRLDVALAALWRLRRETRGAFPQLASLARLLQAQLTEDVSHLPAGWSVVNSWQEPERFNELIGHDGPLYCNYMHPGAPYGGILGIPGGPNDAERQGLQNASFHVLRDRRIFATVPLVANETHVLAGVTNHPAVGCLPAEICFAADSHVSAGDVRSVLTCILHVARAFGADSVLLAERLGDPMYIQSVLDASHLYSCEIWTRPVVQLGKDEAVLASQVRKSYRSLINWGKNNLQMEYLSGDSLTDDVLKQLFSTIQTLHAEIIRTYGDGMNSELYLFPMLACRRGCGEVALARDAQGEVVGMIVTSDEGGVAYYALAGTTKVQGKSVGHFLLFDAILRAGHRGMRRYAVNRYFSAPVAVDEHALRVREERSRQMIFFKSGFSEERERLVVYRARLT